MSFNFLHLNTLEFRPNCVTQHAQLGTIVSCGHIYHENEAPSAPTSIALKSELSPLA